MIGTFGDIVFETSSSKLFTMDEFKRTGGAIFAEHAVLDNKAKLEHVGDDLDSINFSIRLDVQHQVNPLNEIKKLKALMSAGDEKKMIIGGNVLGSFVLVSMEEQWGAIDNKGNLLTAKVELALKEYA